MVAQEGLLTGRQGGRERWRRTPHCASRHRKAVERLRTSTWHCWGATPTSAVHLWHLHTLFGGALRLGRNLVMIARSNPLALPGTSFKPSCVAPATGSWQARRRVT